MLGCNAMPQTSSNRISFFTIFITGALVYWYWEAMVISYLAVRTVQLPINSLYDLLKKSKLKVTWTLGYYIFNFIFKILMNH